MSEWRDINSAPEAKGEYFFCRLAWGPERDQCTGDGFRWNGRWFVAAIFHNPGRRFDECQQEFRQIEVQPTHWMPKPAPPQGIEAGTAKTRRGLVHESPVGRQADAPKGISTIDTLSTPPETVAAPIPVEGEVERLAALLAERNARTDCLLGLRDKFIVDRGLWQDFVDQLPERLTFSRGVDKEAAHAAFVLAAAKIERGTRLDSLTDDEEKSLVNAILSALHGDQEG